MLLPAFVSFKRLQVNIVCVNSNELLRFIPFYSSSGYAFKLRHVIRCQASSTLKDVGVQNILKSILADPGGLSQTIF